MNRREFMTAALAVGTSCLLGSARAHGAADTHPNIVLFMVDDMGWQDTSVPFADEPTRFNQHFRTPNMERLARTGTCFTNAYSHPVCTPTRTSWMSGQCPARTHITNWTFAVDRDTSNDWGGFSAPRWRREGLQPHDLTLPKILRAEGYRTIHCGKAHFGGYNTPGADPRNLGYDVNIAGSAAGHPQSYQGEANYGNKRKGAWTDTRSVPGLEAYHGTDTHLTDALTIEVKKEIARAVESGTPFFVNMAPFAVHTPIQPNQQFMDHYLGKKYPGTDIDIPDVEAKYATMVEGMDKALGALLDQLEDLGIAQNTLVIFTSDNGGLSAHARGINPLGANEHTHNRPLRAGKASAYEGGIRVPFIVSWAKPDSASPIQQPLPIEAGGRSDQPLIVQDLFPTIAAIAGAADRIPADYPLDGVDCRAYYTQQARDPDRPLYFHYPHGWGPQMAEHEAHSELRAGDWKVIYWYYRGEWELFNLRDDIGEHNNLAATEPVQLKTMATQLVNGLEAMGAQWPINNETGQPFTPPIPA